MSTWVYFLSHIITASIFAYLFYAVYKRNTLLENEITILGCLVKAQDNKSERRSVEFNVKTINMEKKICKLEEKIEKSMEHIESQNGVLLQRITNMKNKV